VPLIYRLPHMRNLNVMQTSRLLYAYAANESILKVGICKRGAAKIIAKYNSVRTENEQLYTATPVFFSISSQSAVNQ